MKQKELSEEGLNRLVRFFEVLIEIDQLTTLPPQMSQ